MGSQKLIIESYDMKSYVKNEIKKLENETKILNKLYVILDVLYDVPISEIAEKHAISIPTVYNWIKQWNYGGIEGLKRKKGSGGKAKLSKEQFIILDVIVQQMNLTNTKQIKRIIEEVFGVTYSVRQVERIMHKLDHNDTEP